MSRACVELSCSARLPGLGSDRSPRAVQARYRFTIFLQAISEKEYTMTDANAYIEIRYKLSPEVMFPGMEPFSVCDDDFFDKMRQQQYAKRHKLYMSASPACVPGIWQRKKSRGSLRMSWEPQDSSTERKGKRRVFLTLEPGENCEVGVYVSTESTMFDIYKELFLASAQPEHIKLLKAYAFYIRNQNALAPPTVEFLKSIDDNNIQEVELWKALSSASTPPSFEEVLKNKWLRESSRVQKKRMVYTKCAKTIQKMNTKKSNGIHIGPTTAMDLDAIMHAPVDSRVNPFDSEFFINNKRDDEDDFYL